MNYTSDLSIHTFIQRSDYAKSEVGDWKVKTITLIDFPIGGKQAYLDWALSNAPALIEQPELKAVASYDNYYGVSPHRLVTREFASVADAEAWYALEARKAFGAEQKNYVHSRVEHTFEQIVVDTNE